MNILFLDLELNINQDEGNTPTSHTTDIIQIGAAILDTNTGLITNTFSRYCKLITPLDNKELRLSKFINKLTGISDEDVNNGVDLVVAYQDLVDFCIINEVSRMAGTWGSGDMQELRDQVRVQSECDQGEYNGQEIDLNKYELLYFKSPDLVEMNAYYMRKVPIWWFSKYEHTGFFDVKKMYQSYCIANSISAQSGLKKSMNKLKLTLDKNMSYHDAVSDAYGTAKIYYFLLQKLKQ